MRIQTRHMHASITQRFVEFVIRHPSGPIRLPELAKVVGMSPAYLTRLFQEQTGESLANFLRRIRMERSAHRLVNTDLPISSIAFEAGYTVHSNFGRAFSQAYGMTPSDFRRQIAPNWKQEAPSDQHWTSEVDGLTLRPADLTEAEPEVEIISYPDRPYVFHRFEGDYKFIKTTWERISPSLPVLQDATFITVYHDSGDSRPRNQMRADLGFFSPHPVPGWENGCMPGGVYVRSFEAAAGEDLHRTWCTMHRHWIPSRGMRPVNVPAFQESRTNPAHLESPKCHITIGLELDLGDPV